LKTVFMSPAAPTAAVARPQMLDALPRGQQAQVVGVPADSAVAAWLAAVGIAQGEELLVLRRGLFGGPLHVRTGCGGEFAVARSLAAEITVVPVVA
jgi:ferrous iron transport protein A